MIEEKQEQLYIYFHLYVEKRLVHLQIDDHQFEK